jgi:glycosyltransferase involved in cell wall biosynthesis
MGGAVNSDRANRLCVYIPCFNAAPFLARTVERIPWDRMPAEVEITVVFVDNASTDITREVIEQCRVRLEQRRIASAAVLHPENRGYGGSVKSALRWALDKDFDFLAVLHADGQYSPEELPRLLSELRADETVALHFGSRLAGRPLAGGMPLYKFLANHMLSGLQNLALGTYLSEFHSGYRLYRLAHLRSCGFERAGDSFVFDNQIIFLLRMKGHKITESPIATFYGEETSHVPKLATPLGILANTLRYAAARTGIWKDGLYRT